MARSVAALVGVAAALEQVESLPDAFQKLRRAEELDPRRGEPDREREPAVQATDQLVHGGGVGDVGSTACARSTNSVTASPSSIGGRSNSDSPAMRSVSRLVATIRRAGGGGEQLGERPGGAGQELLQVVEDDVGLLVTDARRDRGDIVGGSAQSPGDQAHHQCAASRTGRAGTNTVPSSASPDRNRASSIENRVLPAPLTGIIVSNARLTVEPLRGGLEQLALTTEEVSGRSREVDGTRRPQR